MSPNLPKRDIGNGALAHAVAVGDVPLILVSRKALANLAHHALRQLCIVMLYAARLRESAFFKAVSMKHVCNARHPFEIACATVRAIPVLVIYLVAQCRARWKECSSDNAINLAVKKLLFAFDAAHVEFYLRITFRRGRDLLRDNVLRPDVSDAPKVRHFVSARRAKYRMPVFHAADYNIVRMAHA